MAAVPKEEEVVFIRPDVPGAPTIAAPKDAKVRALVEKVATACSKNPAMEKIFKQKCLASEELRRQFAFLDGDNQLHGFYVYRKQMLRHA